MIICYGDFKDLNHISSVNEPSTYSSEVHAKTLPYWEMFQGGKLNLTKRNLSKDDWKSCKAVIHITNYVFDEHEYSTYSILLASEGVCRYAKEKKHKWIDRENDVIVTEELISQIGREPNFAEVKEREITYNKKERKRVFPYLDEAVPTKISDLYTEGINRWKKKNDSRWFY